MNLKTIKGETGTYVEIPRNRITFKSKEAEIIFDLTLENDELRLKNQELKKQLENYKKLGFKYLQDKNNDLETQQKEFIKYLEDEINKWNYNYDSYNYEYEVEEPTAEELANKILQKYKSIIGE
jgi:hypothetical protein